MEVGGGGLGAVNANVPCISMWPMPNRPMPCTHRDAAGTRGHLPAPPPCCCCGARQQRSKLLTADTLGSTGAGFGALRGARAAACGVPHTGGVYSSPALLI